MDTGIWSAPLCRRRSVAWHCQNYVQDHRKGSWQLTKTEMMRSWNCFPGSSIVGGIAGSHLLSAPPPAADFSLSSPPCILVQAIASVTRAVSTPAIACLSPSRYFSRSSAMMGALQVRNCLLSIASPSTVPPANPAVGR